MSSSLSQPWRWFLEVRGRGGGGLEAGLHDGEPCLLVAVGYALLLPFHGSTLNALVNMAVAVALATTGSLDPDAAAGHAPLAGYLTVWSVCAVTALVAAIALFVVPKGAFADPVTTG